MHWYLFPISLCNVQGAALWLPTTGGLPPEGVHAAFVCLHHPSPFEKSGILLEGKYIGKDSPGVVSLVASNATLHLPQTWSGFDSFRVQDWVVSCTKTG